MSKAVIFLTSQINEDIFLLFASCLHRMLETMPNTFLDFSIHHDLKNSNHSKNEPLNLIKNIGQQSML